MLNDSLISTVQATDACRIIQTPAHGWSRAVQNSCTLMTGISMEAPTNHDPISLTCVALWDFYCKESTEMKDSQSFGRFISVFKILMPTVLLGLCCRIEHVYTSDGGKFWTVESSSSNIGRRFDWPLELASKRLARGGIRNNSWASYHMRNIAGCACARNAENVFPTTNFKGNC